MDDREATGGALRRGLSPRSERIARAAIEAMLADEDAAGNLVAPSRTACDRAVDWLTHATGNASGDVRRGFGVLTFFLQILPFFVIGRAARMTSLPLDERIRYLEGLETHRIGLLAMLCVAFKVPMCIAAFEEGDELRSTGFDRPSTTARRNLLASHDPSALAAGAPPAEGAAL